ncbi:hypothetical protein Q666_02550 [Marinobacter sp. ES-1]|uniref:type II secretion system F family protein n=1 Tax=Marinobacter sp. ES-1 TaxID=1396858 RepID=UPI0003B84F5A|nr:type II secretion system F family protein [Marinobacter sp. ES-1]ERP90173.1 hypothetical protein Q666_02550 [Marinobacter sp. ES-1]
MSVQVIWLAALFFGALAVVVMLLQLVIGQVRHDSNLKKLSKNRLYPQIVTEDQKKAGIDIGPLEQLLIRAGIRMSVTKVVVVAVLFFGSLIGVYVYRGPIEALVALVAVVLIGVTLWRVKFERLRRQIFEELPGIVDAVLRSLVAGRSVEQSLLVAFADASDVFQPLSFRLRGAVSQGRDYTRIFDDFAELYSVPPFTQIAIALRTSARFGSSVRPVLQEVSKAIRARQELRREFMAATSETRFTAVVFAILPPAMGAYIVLMNEEFSEALLHTSTGHTMMITAGVLQVLGTLLIWNLIRGVGRG